MPRDEFEQLSSKEIHTLLKETGYNDLKVLCKSSGFLSGLCELSSIQRYLLDRANLEDLLDYYETGEIDDKVLVAIVRKLPTLTDKERRLLYHTCTDSNFKGELCSTKEVVEYLLKDASSEVLWDYLESGGRMTQAFQRRMVKLLPQFKFDDLLMMFNTHRKQWINTPIDFKNRIFDYMITVLNPKDEEDVGLFYSFTENLKLLNPDLRRKFNAKF